MRRLIAWLVAPGLERLALENQQRHKTLLTTPNTGVTT